MANSRPAGLRFADAVLVLPDRLIPEGAVDVLDGRIVRFGPAALLGPTTGSVVNCAGRFLSPGFVDMHVHGGDGADFMDGPRAAFETVIAAHARHGTTGIAPTSTVARHDQTLAFLKNTRDVMLAGPQPQRGLTRVVGSHLYGPFFAPDKVGCHPKSPARPPGRDEYSSYLEFADAIRVATCAPELAGSAEFYRDAAACGIRLNAGHSNADWAEMEQAYELGVRHVDHFYCAMSSVPALRLRFGTPMRASMLEFVLAHDDITTEIISDGRHLSPELLRFVLKMKGVDATALVTDCNRALDLPEGEYVFGPLDGGEKFVSEGGVGWMPDRKSLASSTQGMDHMVRHMHQGAGVDLPAAVRMASLTPAKILGVDAEIGSIAIGKRADLILLDGDLRVTDVYVDGSPVRLRARP